MNVQTRFWFISAAVASVKFQAFCAVAVPAPTFGLFFPCLQKIYLLIRITNSNFLQNNIKFSTREKKKTITKEAIFVGRKLCSGSDKMSNASGHQCKVKMSSGEKRSEREHVRRHFLPKTCNKEYTKKVCCTCKVAFLLIRPIDVFHRSPALPSTLSIHHSIYFV